MKKIRMSVYLPLFLVTAVSATERSEARLALQEQLIEMPQFHAQFSQKVTDFDGLVLQQSHGVIALQVPNKFYWHQNDPDESLILADGESVWLYDPMLEQATRFGLDVALAQTPLALLASQDEALWQEYTINRADSCYVMQPIATDVSITEMEICFAANGIDSLAFLDSQGIRSHLILEDFSTEVETQQFDFTVPDDVYIDDQRTQ